MNIFWITALAVMLCTDAQNIPMPSPITPSFCDLTLANGKSAAALTTEFQNAVQTGKIVVYFNLVVSYPNVSRPVPFSVSNSDTFSPSLWLWATNSGKKLLRMPLDYSIMSLGLLTINTYEMNIPLDGSTQDCFASKNYTDVAHVIAKFIAENITANGTSVGVSQDVPVVCRSAFAFFHHIFGERGIGFKCGSAPSLVAGPLYNCSTPYSDAWTLVRYGPTALICWVYLIVFVHLCKVYTHIFDKSKTIDEIKHDIVCRIPCLLTLKEGKYELIALHERCGLLDILGVNIGCKAKVNKVLPFFFVTFSLMAYYVFIGVFFYVYKIQLEPILQLLNDTHTSYINVIGHFGWLFLRADVQLFWYAVFETFFTIALPLFVFVVYLYISYQGEPAAESSALKAAFHRFATSKCSKFLGIICFALIMAYIAFVAGVFLCYVVFFSSLGILINIGVVSPWIIPLGVCLHFFGTVLDPVKNLYKNIQGTLFTICMKSYKGLIITQENFIFVPRRLLDQFYIPRSKSVLYTCLLHIMWGIAFMILLTLLILTLEYPYYNQTLSSFLFLDQNLDSFPSVVFIIPLIAQVVLNNQQNNSLEQAIFLIDIEEHIKKYSKMYPDIFHQPESLTLDDNSHENEVPISGKGIISDNGVTLALN